MAKEMSPLISIPLDIVECLFENLELADIKNTRLICKYLSAIGPRFKSFVAKQTTDLSVESLRRQHDLASHSGLRTAVKTLVVMAAVFDTSELDLKLETKKNRTVEVTGVFTKTSEVRCTEEEIAQATSDLEWMHSEQNKQKNKSLAENITDLASVLSQYGRLDTIDLEAVVIKGPTERCSAAQAGEWYPVLTRASEVYRITTSAIAKSEIALKTLLIYRTTRRCSVPSFDVTMHMAHLESLSGFASTFSSLENFAISFSTRIPTNFSNIEAAREQLEGADAAFHNAMGSSAGQYSGTDPEATAEENFPGIARMLSQMPKLDAFDLHMLNTLERSSANGYQKIFQHIADEVKLPLLTQVFIRGLPTSEESLLKFIKNHPKISELYLNEIELTSGSWKHVLREISQLQALSLLNLSNLWDGEGIFNLISKNAGDDKISDSDMQQYSVPCMGGIMVHTRTFEREEIRILATLDYDDRDLGRPLGSPQAMRWRTMRRSKYYL